MLCVAKIIPNFAPAHGEGIDLPGWCCRSTDALHGADAASFQAVQQQPQQLQLPEKPKTELVSNSDDSQTVIIKMPRVAEPVTTLQVSHTHVTAHAVWRPNLVTEAMHEPIAFLAVGSLNQLCLRPAQQVSAALQQPCVSEEHCSRCVSRSCVRGWPLQRIFDIWP